MHRPSRYPESGRRALLIDLDNIVIQDGELLAPTQAQEVLRRILIAASPRDYVLAVAPAPTVMHVGSALLALGIRWQWCGPEPDAADHQLCLVACDLVERGYSDLAVASGDHFFACLADIARLTIVVPKGQPVARELARRGCVLAA